MKKSWWLACAAVAISAAMPAHAFNFGTLPAADMSAPPAPSAAATSADYKRDAARHLYAAFPKLVYKGKLPPLLYGVAIVETQVDAAGKVLGARILRPPAGPGVSEWIVKMIQNASPFPAPGKLGESSFTEIWLVDRSGRFQVDTLTEGQH